MYILRLFRRLPVLLLVAGCSTGGEPTGQVPVSLEFVRTVVVMPDANYHNGGFTRVNYVQATGRLLVTFGAESTTPTEGSGFAYKVYTTDMEETGESGHLVWDHTGDMGSVLVGNTYYLATFPLFPDDGPSNGWRITTFDASTLQQEATVLVTIPLDGTLPSGQLPNNDPMLAYVNGQLDISCQYNPSGRPPDLFQGTGTYHLFLDEALQPLGERYLTDTPHIVGSSMVYLDGIYYFVSAQSFLGGDLIVMTYDQDWTYLGSKELGVGPAHWSTGLVYDGQRFYVAYLDNSAWSRPEPTIFPIYLNVHLGVFDANWNLITDVAVTDFGPANSKAAGRPWVLLHDNRLYVSYDVDAIDPTSVPAEAHQGEAWVSVYDLIGSASAGN